MKKRMKSTNLVWYEVTKEEVQKLSTCNVQVLIYNPFNDRFSLETTGKRCIANSKHAEPTLRYYLLKTED